MRRHLRSLFLFAVLAISAFFVLREQPKPRFIPFGYPCMTYVDKYGNESECEYIPQTPGGLSLGSPAQKNGAVGYLYYLDSRNTP